MDKRLNRFELLVGEDKVALLKKKTVLVCGLGGVGGTCLESLARSGVGSFIIVDFDRVDISNLNRQILFVASDVGLEKVVAAEQRLKSISDNISVQTFSTRINETFFDQVKKLDIDFIIDAIDSPYSKLALIEFALQSGVGFISSLGMANRFDPTAVRIGTLAETSLDPLAKKMRALMRKKNINLQKIPVVYSLEKPIDSGPTLASVMNVPSSAGLALSFFCLEHLLK